CQWSAQYYHHPLGEVLFASLPGDLRDGKPLPSVRIWRLTHEGKGLPHTALKRAKKQQQLFQYLLQHEIVEENRLSGLGFQKKTLQLLEEKNLVMFDLVREQPEIRSPIPTLLQQAPLALNDE